MLKLENVEISVNDKKLFNNLNLNINNKEIHVIMGPNGIGKSSICQSIIGNPDYQVKGNIIFNNTVINDLGITERSRMGIYIINQNPIAIEGVTNAEMLRTVLTEITGSHVSIFEFNQKLEHICDELKIDKSFIHRNINDGMSGGERKKNELMHMLMHEPKFINLDEIDYALMEVNGNISFLPKEKEKPATKRDMKIKCSNEGLTVNGIIDGKYMVNNMAAINKDKEWLDHELKVNGYDNYDNILLATIDNNYKVTIYEKNVKPDKNTVLE